MTPGGASAGVELRDHVVGAADLERACRLQALGLEVQRPSCRARDIDERRHARDRRDPRRGGTDFFQRDKSGGSRYFSHGSMVVWRSVEIESASAEITVAATSRHAKSKSTMA